MPFAAYRVVCLAWCTLVCCGVASVATGQSVALITAEGQKALLHDPGTDRVGAPLADLIIVEYFDYNCPYCKKIEPDLQRLLTQDGKLALVYKDWPILSDVSIYAAKAALAARWQGKYRIAHDALMNGPKLKDEPAVDSSLEHAGINLTRLKKDGAQHAAEIEALLARNEAEAHALSIRGTPGIVIGRLLLPGVTDLDGLEQLVAAARREPGS